MAPDEVTDGGSFSAEVNISYVENFDAANYDIIYNASVLNVTGVSNGYIGVTEIPVDSWVFVPPAIQGVVRIINNVGGAPGVDGSGNLSWINFDVVGNVCDSSGLLFNVSVCELNDNLAHNISATWVNDSVHVAAGATATPTCEPPDIFNRVSGNLIAGWERAGNDSFPQAWNTSGATAANATQLDALARIDDEWWRTDLAPDSGYNYHMYNITVPTDPADIDEMIVYWVGNGEGFKNRDDINTSAWIWNDNSDSWEVMQDRDDEHNDGGMVARINSSIGNYINSSTDALFIKVAAEHEETCACPYVYGWSGEGYKLLDTPITTSIVEKYEGTSYASTGVLEPLDGYYDLMMYMPMEHTGYMDSLGLWAVEHEAGAWVLADETGAIHTIGDPQGVEAVDSYGRDVSAILALQDGVDTWTSDLETLDLSDSSEMRDSITITLPSAPDAGIAKLLIDARYTELIDLKGWYYFNYILGTPNQPYLLQRIASDAAFAAAFDRAMESEMAVTVEAWDGEQWAPIAEITNLNTVLGKTAVVPVDLGAVEGDQIRIVMPAGMCQIDWVAVDYSTDKPVTVTVLEPVDATWSGYGDVDAAVSRDVLADIAAEDGTYAVIERGDYINYRFEALGEPAQGMERSFVVPVSGYYYYAGPAVPEDKIDNLPLCQALTCQAGTFARDILPQYASAEREAYLEYYTDTYLEPAFPLDRDSLDANYLGITVAECTTFNETPHGPLKVGDWWMWNVSYDSKIFEDIGENCFDFTQRNWCYYIETVNSSNQSVQVFYNQDQRNVSSGHWVTNCTVIDYSNDKNWTAVGRGSNRSVTTGTQILGTGDQAQNYMLDGRRWVSPWDATTFYKLQSLVFVNTTINEVTLSNNWYTQGGDQSNHSAENYGYPFALGDSLATHEYYAVFPDFAIAPDQNVERDWETRVVSYEEDYNVSNASEWMYPGQSAYNHDGGAVTGNAAVYDVWVTDQYQTSTSYGNARFAPESGSRIHWYAPEVKHDVRRLDAYQYTGAEDYTIQAYEVGTYSASNLVVSWGANTNWSVNITNTDSSSGKYINVLGLILNMSACYPSGTNPNASECFINGETIYPDVHNPDSGTWPFFNAIKHVWFNASESKVLNWNTSVSTATGSNWSVWCQGQYLKKP